MMVDSISRPKKRLFLALILVSLTVTSFLIYGIWRVSEPGLTNISAQLPALFGLFLMVLLILITIGVIGIILAIMGMNTLGIFQIWAWYAINLLFPSAIRIGRLFDIDKEKVERSFIEVSNHLVRQKKIIVPPKKVLILMPHCVQQENCSYKITKDPFNCRGCGNCQMGELIALVKKWGVELSVVTGGTLARKVIQTLRPQIVLAVACERDLTSGIQDVFPLPVIGVLNERPFGPCCNTRIDLKAIEGVLSIVVKK